MFKLSSNSLQCLSDFVSDQTGLHFPKDRWKDLERGIQSAAKEFHFNDPDACIRWLLTRRLTRGQIEILSSHLTVGETYFFRDSRMFEVLQERILPDLIRSRRETTRSLRIWSAACCTGEEPYTLAILLNQMIPDLENWNLTILGTDINTRFLRKAMEANYGRWSFRDSRIQNDIRYFRKTRDGRFSVVPSLTKKVVFSYLNLAEDSYPSLVNETNGMDLILCRNVLMYFEPQRAKRVIEKLYRCLVDGGWLIVSPVESNSVSFSKFKVFEFGGMLFYQKETSRFERSDCPESTFENGSKHISEIESPVEFHDGDPSPPAYREAPSADPEGSESGTVPMLSGRTDNGQSASLRARACANQGKIEEARSWIEQAIDADKLNAVFHYLRAMILQEQGEFETAIASLKHAIYIDPKFVLAHFMLGMLTIHHGNIKNSQRHFQHSLALLQDCEKEHVLPESDGITAGRLIEIIQANALLEDVS